MSLTRNAAQDAKLAALTAELTDRGLLVEAGFVGLKMLAIPADAPQLQVDEMRNAFFAGAHHVYTSIMNVLDPGDEPSERDLKRMMQIDAELKAFIRDFELKHLPTRGQA